MNKWISINEKLPDHEQIVLATTNKNRQVVCIYLDGKKQTEKLNSLGFSCKPQLDSFCSQEIPGNVLNGVTHWRSLIPGPNVN